jgi:hypothetical protein
MVGQHRLGKARARGGYVGDTVVAECKAPDVRRGDGNHSLRRAVGGELQDAAATPHGHPHGAVRRDRHAVRLAGRGEEIRDHGGLVE